MNTAHEGIKWNNYQPQEYSYACTRCFEEDINPFDSTMHLVNEASVCHECCSRCDGCGEMIDDETVEHCGPEVVVRRWELNGKKSSNHAECAANEFIGDLIDIGNFDFTEHSREEIADIVAQRRTA